LIDKKQDNGYQIEKIKTQKYNVCVTISIIR